MVLHSPLQLNERDIGDNVVTFTCANCIQFVTENDGRKKSILDGRQNSSSIVQFYMAAIIEGFRAKRAYVTFWADFYFLQDRANFWH